MVDTTIFGIDSNIVGIYANIGVAIGTLILALGTIYLAWYTSKSVQTSKETLESLKTQVDIAKKDFENKQTELEKPQIIDQLQYVLNPLRNNINNELRQINENLIFWEFLRIGKSSHSFPMKEFREFYDEANSSTPLGMIIYRIDIGYTNFSELCHERHKLILNIFDLISEFYAEIKKQEFDKKIVELIKKRDDYFTQPAGLNEFTNEQLYNEGIHLYDFSDGFPRSCIIPFDAFKSIIFDVGIAKFLAQRVITNDSDNNLIIQEFSDYEAEFKNFFTTQKFNKYSETFQSLINKLKEADNRLFGRIDEIRLSYQNRYHLTDDEYWKISQFNKNA